MVAIVTASNNKPGGLTYNLHTNTTHIVNTNIVRDTKSVTSLILKLLYDLFIIRVDRWYKIGSFFLQQFPKHISE